MSILLRLGPRWPEIRLFAGRSPQPEAEAQIARDALLLARSLRT